MVKFMIVGTGDDGSPVCLNQRVMLDRRTPGLYETPEKASHVLSAFLKYPRTKFGVSPSVRNSLHVVPCPDSWSSHPDLAVPDAKTPPDGYFIRGTGETGTLFLNSIAQMSPEPFVWKTKDAADRVLCSFQTSPGLHADLPGALIGTFAVFPYRADDPDPFNGAEPESCHALTVLSTLLSLASLDFAVLEQELTAGLSRADLAKSDILHKIELSDELDEEKTIRILRDVLKKRRAYKDGLLLLSEFRTAGGVEALSRMAKKKDGFPDRLYRPRVLTDLFPDPDTDKEVLS